MITPTHTLHDLFAGHEDTAYDFCRVHHSHLGTHIEEQHTHCDILKLNTPIYSLPELVIVQALFFEIKSTLSDYSAVKTEPNLQYSLHSRAPPVS